MKRGSVFVLLAAPSKMYIGSVLFRTSAYTDAKKASRVTFWFRDLSRQNHLDPFFPAGHLVPLFGSPRPVFYNGVKFVNSIFMVLFESASFETEFSVLFGT